MKHRIQNPKDSATDGTWIKHGPSGAWNQYGKRSLYKETKKTGEDEEGLTTDGHRLTRIGRGRGQESRRVSHEWGTDLNRRGHSPQRRRGAKPSGAWNRYLELKGGERRSRRRKRWEERWQRARAYRLFAPFP